MVRNDTAQAIGVGIALVIVFPTIFAAILKTIFAAIIVGLIVAAVILLLFIYFERNYY